MVANMLTLKYGRGDEHEADQLGLRFMYLAGYDPRSMVRGMEILEQASGGAGSSRPEFASTHPNPGNRVERIEAWVKETFPTGVPGGLTK
jgi:predicted Zn-dependent protease